MRWLLWVGYVTPGTPDGPGVRATREEWTCTRPEADQLARNRRADLSWIPAEHRATAVVVIEGPYRVQGEGLAA